MDDIIEVEYRFLRSLQQWLNLDSVNFYSGDQTKQWTTEFADGYEYDLTEDGEGASRSVQFDERFDYIRKALKARL